MIEIHGDGLKKGVKNIIRSSKKYYVNVYEGSVLVVDKIIISNSKKKMCKCV